MATEIRQEIKTFVERVGDLLKTPHRHESEILHTKYTINRKLEEASGKHGDVFFVSNKDSVAKTNTFAVKRQPIRYPTSLDDKSYRELIILQHISSLAENNKCYNFVVLIEWFKATPDLLTPEKKRNDNKENSVANNAHKKPPQLMHFVLEYADGNTLAGAKHLSLAELKGILFQLLYALAVAQEELGFVHNDLHFGNILLKSMPLGKKYLSCTYSPTNGKDSTWFVGGHLVKITDFGLSRIRSKDEQVIYNTKDSAKATFSHGTDVESLFMGLRAYPLKGDDLEEKKKFRSLKKRMSNGENPARLLNDPFFSALKEAPLDANVSNTIHVNSTGTPSVPNFPLTPAHTATHSYPLSPQASDFTVADVQRELSFAENDEDATPTELHGGDGASTATEPADTQKTTTLRRSARIKKLVDVKTKRGHTQLQLDSDVAELTQQVASLSVQVRQSGPDNPKKHRK